MKMLWAAIAHGALLASASPTKRAQSSDEDQSLIAKLKTDGTKLDQYHDILDGRNVTQATVFDFNTGYQVPGAEGGETSRAYVDNFPMLLDTGISFSISALGPCGIFFPHVHPRANELFVVIEGEVGFGAMFETAINPADTAKPIGTVNGTLSKFQGTLFPQGSIHWQINDSDKCEQATIVAAFGSDDPGVTAVLQQVADGDNLKAGMQEADVGDIEQYYPFLPPALVDASKKCLTRCKK
ncbi:Spherulin-1B [Pseudocercospora fuligena]|uniref:Spherulin-1B n=1 Tax=Pseudocercospora fuligena TaxID=685502 RepID=A0A8H6VIH6_9PEZI|nr:Spherulin-1B [Pseudocercospora fuligena]